MEVAAATVITSLLLIPSLSLLDQSRRLSQRHQTREQLVYEAQRLIDTRKAELIHPGTFQSDYRRPTGRLSEAALAGSGISDGRYQVETIADGNYRGTGAEILKIRVSTWQDLDRDRTLDPDEPSATLVTKLSRPR